ncbi:nitrite/sulfite reductase [Luminiphilus sp.]|nr:nitrite/sulfite reductase [Luminiphilus sp.]MDC0572085.1 nitrite/sulfite reductase [Luminiphilus sp.]
MYQYSEFDKAFLQERVAQYRDQVARRLTGALTEEEFKPLRLMNGVYLQLHAYMLRVAIPYGTLSAAQMRGLADISERWDRGYGHFTTRQNIQFNWPKLVDTPDILEALAGLDMHAIQTSGNTVRNVTTDHFAGAALDEVDDPRPYAEWIRQWSTDHPEFQFLPRKFKIAISAGQQERALVKAHDIGLRLVAGDGEPAFDIYVGGGLGRTPVVGSLVFERVSVAELLPHIEAILTVYNLAGRRDNKYKARIKILLQSVSISIFKCNVERLLPRIIDTFDQHLIGRLERLKSDFATPVLPPRDVAPYWDAVNNQSDFKAWVTQNVTPHKQEGYASVTVSLKAHGQAPGDASAAQMRVLAELAEQIGFAELRVSHEQNIVLPHVAQSDLMAVFDQLKREGLATANIGLVSDLIACPGMDYCALATARSIPIAQQIARRYQHLEPELGPLKIKISGCINACGHHHVGDIGILGLDKAGVENYQITLGGRVGMDAALGEKMGPGFSEPELLLALDRLFEAYLAMRLGSDEVFSETVKRLGTSPFKSALYEVADAA